MDRDSSSLQCHSTPTFRASTKATVLIAEEMGSLRSSMKQAAEASQMAANAALTEAQKLNSTLMVWKP